MINTQQLIVLMPLFKVNMPANVQIFFNQVTKIASFNLINVEPLINKILHLNQTLPLDQNFGALGFNSLYFMNNMGSLLIAIFIICVGIVFLFCIDNYVWLLWVSNLSAKIRSSIFYDAIVSTFIESYAFMSVSCLIAFNKISFDSPGETIQTLVNFLFFGLLFIFPAILLTVVTKAWKKGQLKSLKENY